MMKDREQKQKALRLAVANRWYPAVEVDVQPVKSLSTRVPLVTDLDVYASIPDEINAYRSVVFDCKTKAKESPVNRALWLAGVLKRINGDQGFCILKKDEIELDHRLMAMSLGVVLLAEDEFDLYAKSISQRYGQFLGHIGEMETWEHFYSIPLRYQRLEAAFRFIRSTYWMTDDSAEACRKTIACLKSIQPELDPAKFDHIAVFLDFCSIFSHSLANVVCNIFKAYLHPKTQLDLSEALLVMLYGGRESYQHRNELYKLVSSKNLEPQHSPDLSLPEWERFLQLVRQLLDAPVEFLHTPLILKEVGFSILRSGGDQRFAKSLCSESPHGAKFALLITNYLAKATRLPPEFQKISDDILINLIPVK